jgi:hypothetical protein
MGFPPDVAERALLDCGRSCCICHKFCGFKIELHHIIQKSEGGADTYDNCIPLCLDCHAEVKAYNPKHPKGRQYNNSELKQHRDRWYDKVRNNQLITATPEHIELDRQMFMRIQEMLPSTGSISFIRGHGYSASFPIEKHKDLHKFYMEGEKPEFEFIDADLETFRARLDDNVGKFLNVIALKTFPSHLSGSNQVPPEWELHQPELYEETLEKIHDLAQKVCSSYDDLIRLGRRKLGVSMDNSSEHLEPLITIPEDPEKAAATLGRYFQGERLLLLLHALLRNNS